MKFAVLASTALMLVTLDIYAHTDNKFSIINKTKPHETINVSCTDVTCEQIVLSYERQDKLITRSELELKESQKAPIVWVGGQWQGNLPLDPYELTQRAVSKDERSVEDMWKEGYEADAVFTAIGRGVFVSLCAIVDTVILPKTIMNRAYYYGKDPKVLEIKKRAKKIEKSLVNENNIAVKERIFKQYRKFFYSL